MGIFTTVFLLDLMSRLCRWKRHATRREQRMDASIKDDFLTRFLFYESGEFIMGIWISLRSRQNNMCGRIISHFNIIIGNCAHVNSS